MAFFIGINGCGLGFFFHGGAVELGKTTTKSIVINLICRDQHRLHLRRDRFPGGLERGVIRVREVGFAFPGQRCWRPSASTSRKGSPPW